MIEKREDLGNAIALNSSMVNAARLLGPMIAGLVIAATSEGWCFLIDGVSYVAVMAAPLMMRIDRPSQAPMRSGMGVGAQVAEGFRSAFGFAPIRAIILLLALVSVVGVPYSLLIPVFATDVFHGVRTRSGSS